MLDRLSGLGSWKVLVSLGACGALCTACGSGPASYADAGAGAGSNGGSGAGSSSSSSGSGAGGGLGYDPVKPNIMLLIDRSGSMSQPADCGEALCPSKWQQLLTLGPYLAEAKKLARLGLAVFPSPEYNGCVVSPSVLVPLSDAADVDQQMIAAAQAAAPGGMTPVAAAIDEIGLIGGLDDRSRDNILLVMTDGQPNCVCDSLPSPCSDKDHAVASVERLVNSDPPVDIDIIGFGTSAQEAHDTLSAMAAAAGDEQYYQSNTIEELIGTLYEVGTSNAPCEFYLDGSPEPDKLVAWADGDQVPVCPAEPCDSGYTYEPATAHVVFHGATCALLRDGQQHQVWFEELP